MREPALSGEDDGVIALMVMARGMVMAVRMMAVVLAMIVMMRALATMVIVVTVGGVGGSNLAIPLVSSNPSLRARGVSARFQLHPRSSGHDVSLTR